MVSAPFCKIGFMQKNRDVQDFVIVMLKMFGGSAVAVVYLMVMLMLLANARILFLIVLLASIAGLAAWLKRR